MKLFLSLIGLFTLTTWIYFHFFVYVDPLNFCFIVTPPSFFYNNIKIKDGISLIKATSPEDYKKLCQRVKIIDTGTFCPPEENIAGCYRPQEKHKIYAKSEHSTAYTSTIIIHELCHALQDSEGRLTPASNPEPECYAKDGAFFSSISVQ